MFYSKAMPRSDPDGTAAARLHSSRDVAAGPAADLSEYVAATRRNEAMLKHTARVKLPRSIAARGPCGPLRSAAHPAQRQIVALTVP